MDFVKGLHRYAVYNKKYGKAKRLPVFQGKRATAYGGIPSEFNDERRVRFLVLLFL